MPKIAYEPNTMRPDALSIAVTAADRAADEQHDRDRLRLAADNWTEVAAHVDETYGVN